MDITGYLVESYVITTERYQRTSYVYFNMEGVVLWPCQISVATESFRHDLWAEVH